MFGKIISTESYNEYQDLISFHSSQDSLHDYATLTDENGKYTYIVVTK